MTSSSTGPSHLKEGLVTAAPLIGLILADVAVIFGAIQVRDWLGKAFGVVLAVLLLLLLSMVLMPLLLLRQPLATWWTTWRAENEFCLPLRFPWRARVAVPPFEGGDSHAPETADRKRTMADILRERIRWAHSAFEDADGEYWAGWVRDTSWLLRVALGPGNQETFDSVKGQVNSNLAMNQRLGILESFLADLDDGRLVVRNDWDGTAP